ncbi:MAG: hypothetical protein KatS3mg108_3220 [Isosphaeraceae bacterium]|jgi:hypothetical protein|nr:MAG: hypothetical protein KatS3mg108_3220 [Isosphaeraceae bacterium]
MDVGEPLTLSQRVARLESENRRIRRLAACALLILAACGIYLANRNDSLRQIQANRLLITDAHGIPRGSFGVSPSGQAELILRDESGREQFALRADPNGSANLEILRQGRLLASLGGSGLGPALQLFDQAGYIAASLYSWSNGLSGLALNRAQGGLQLTLAKDSSASLRFNDPDGALRSGWSFSPDGRTLAHHDAEADDRPAASAATLSTEDFPLRLKTDRPHHSSPDNPTL